MLVLPSNCVIFFTQRKVRPSLSGLKEIQGYVVDGNNVAYYGSWHNSPPKVQNLQLLMETLEGMIQIIVVTSYLKYHIDKKTQLKALIKARRIIETPPKVDDDVIILSLAKTQGLKIISNDHFRPYYKTFNKSWIDKNRVSFDIKRHSFQLK